jgi:hypothetical protein
MMLAGSLAICYICYAFLDNEIIFVQPFCMLHVAMFRNGLLVLTSSLLYEHNLHAVVKASSSAIRNLLYVHLISDKSAVTVPDESLVVQVPFTHAVRSYITRFYTEAARVSQSLEVRFLVGNISNLPLQSLPPQTLEKQYEVVLTDLTSTQHNKLTEYLQHQFPVQSPFVIKQFEDIDRVAVDGLVNVPYSDNLLAVSYCVLAACVVLHAKPAS